VEGYGVLAGTTTVIPSSTATVNKFLGVPYASKPTRFELPQSAEPWDSVYDASENKPACIQTYVFPNSTRDLMINFVTGGSIPEESEDCLYLNIFAPSSANATSNKTVLVWIYGGDLELGSNSNPQYDGSNFAANEDVIIVSINYRVNVFGFPGAPEIDKTKNNLG
jgi:carboxylesterase 3/5